VTLTVGVFDVDATPPVPSPLAYQTAVGVTDPLSCRGLVLSGDFGRVVLCAVDWIGISNGGHRRWQEALARGADVGVESVSSHTLHPHDTPIYDTDADAVLASIGHGGQAFDGPFVDGLLERVSTAVAAAVRDAAPVTHIGLGAAPVRQVASNRRVLDERGMVPKNRMSSCKDPELRAAPEGVIDPNARVIAFYQGDRLVTSVSYYASHPQSYYLQALVTPDFVGLARNLHEQRSGAPAIHFCGAAGNVAAGKYNDGSHEMRPVLTERLAAGLEAALADAERHRTPITDDQVGWRQRLVRLPLAEYLRDGAAQRNFEAEPIFRRARSVVWARRCEEGDPVAVSCLRLGDARVLHWPGELFVEYQLASQALRPDLFVVNAAYADFAPGYIGTRVAYPQGGYEVGPVSRVSPDVEDVLWSAAGELLDADISDARAPSDFTETKG
jgi:hypothetical protein